MLPERFSVPAGREKPWGTAHAVMVAKNVINEPFCALNADDFYGFAAYKVMFDFLISSKIKKKGVRRYEQKTSKKLGKLR